MQNHDECTSPGFNFTEVVANCVHEIKNSTGIVINAAECIQNTVTDPALMAQFSILQSEARRINHDLLHLLGLYKLEQSKQGTLPVIVDCEELLLELAAYNETLIQARGLTLELNPDDSIEGYFDSELVISILNSAINNAQRYARQTIRVTCRTRDGYTVFAIEDDGDGYSDEMLASKEIVTGRTHDASNTTGLGLYFASRIAQLHRHRNRVGRITLSNEGIEGGGSFRLWLP